MFLLYIIMMILMIYLIDDTQGGDTALHYAVGNGHSDCVQLLIQSGADANIQNNVSILLYKFILYIIMIILMIPRLEALLCTWQSVMVTMTVSSFLYSLEQMLISRVM